MLPPEPVGYKDIADDLRRQIRSGILSPGQRMLSLDDLSHTYGVARATADRAMQVLKREGLVMGERGKGARVAQRPDVQPVALYVGEDAVVRMPTPEEVRRYGLGEGVPVLEVTGVDGAGRPQHTVYPGDRYRFVVQGRSRKVTKPGQK